VVLLKPVALRVIMVWSFTATSPGEVPDCFGPAAIGVQNGDVGNGSASNVPAPDVSRLVIIDSPLALVGDSNFVLERNHWRCNRTSS